MVRENGEWIFYFVEHFDATRGRWVQSALDYLMFADTPKELHEEARELIKPFQASARCWQKLGINASFDVVDALLVAAFLVKVRPEHKFRVTKVTLSQDTQPFAMFS